jgi:hypothetical protein
VLAFHWLLRYRHDNAVAIHGRYVHQVSRVSERGTSIPQSIIDIVSDVKQRRFKTNFNTSSIVYPELQGQFLDLVEAPIVHSIMHLGTSSDGLMQKI